MTGVQTCALPICVYDKQSQQWQDGDPLFLRCTIWRDPAENIAESLQKGQRVIVTGVLKQRQFETREGEKRSSYEIEAEEVGPSLRYATAKVSRSNRGGSQSGGGGYSNSSYSNSSQDEAPF